VASPDDSLRDAHVDEPLVAAPEHLRELVQETRRQVWAEDLERAARRRCRCRGGTHGPNCPALDWTPEGA
jgi:hypothetical protein